MWSCPWCPEVECGLPFQERPCFGGRFRSPRLVRFVPNRIWQIGWSSGPGACRRPREEDLCGFILKVTHQEPVWSGSRSIMNRECQSKGIGMLLKFSWTIFPLLPSKRKAPSWSRTSWEFRRKNLYFKKMERSLGEKRKVEMSGLHTRHKL